MDETASSTGFRRGVILTSSGSVINLVLLAVETVVAARLLPTSVYGSYVLLLTSVQFLMMVIDLGCKTSVTQLISSGERARQEFVVASALAFRVVVVAGASALIVLVRGLLGVVDSSPDLAEYVGYIPVMLATASFDELLSGMLQGFHAYRPMTIAQIVRGFLRITLTPVLLLVFHWGVAGLVASWSLSFAVAVAYQYYALPARRLWSFSLATLWELLRFGSSLQMTRFLGFASARLHLALLGALAGVDGVAYFAAASRIPDALQTLSDSYFRVYFPTVTTLIAEGRQKAAQLVFSQSLRLVSFGGALAAVVAILFSQEIITLLFSSKYASSTPAFALLMVALYMTVLVNVLGYTLTAYGLPQRSLVVSVVRTVVSAVGDLLLIPGLGVVGSASAAVAASYASNPVGVWLVRLTGLRVDAASYVKQTLILGLCGAVGWAVHPTDLAASLALRVGIIAAFIVLSLRLSTVSLDDIALVAGDRLRRPALRVATSTTSVELLKETRG